MSVMKNIAAALVAACCATAAVAQEAPKPAAPAAAPAGPAVTLRLGAREGDGVPTKMGNAQTGGGTIDVKQVSADTLIVTVSGVAAADAHPGKESSANFAFDLSQCFLVVFEKKDIKGANIYMQGRAVGLLRGGHKGSASLGTACASVSCESPNAGGELVAISVPSRSVGPDDNRVVNVASAPAHSPVTPGQYVLHQKFVIDAAHGKCLPCKAAVSEFAPGPALSPVWIGQRDPFFGAIKKDFGFQVIVKVAPVTADPVVVLQAMAQQLEGTAER